MTKNPFLNALAATLYIILVACIMFYGSQHAPKKDSVLAPIGIISLFTFSAAMMGYIFLYQPILLFLDNKKKQAVDLFLKTTLTFGAITLVILTALFSGILQ